jgi:hypothetical protein
MRLHLLLFRISHRLMPTAGFVSDACPDDIAEELMFLVLDGYRTRPDDNLQSVWRGSLDRFGHMPSCHLILPLHPCRRPSLEMAPGLVKQADRVNEEIRPPMDKTKELHNL